MHFGLLFRASKAKSFVCPFLRSIGVRITLPGSSSL